MVSYSCWWSPWNAFLCVLLTASWSAALYLGSRHINNCLPVHYDDFVHSPWKPSFPDQIPEYTIYQQFCTANLTTNFTQMWSRWPHPLHCSEGRYDILPLDPYMIDGQRCVNASITLYNIRGEIDEGDYKIVVSTACAFDNMTFQMRISKCGQEDIPRPVELTENPVIIPAHNQPPSVLLSFNFFGNNRETDYRFHLTKNGETVCDESSSNGSSHFTCYRTAERQCNATLHVKFYNYTHQDSGLFCVAAFSTSSNSTGNTSCILLDIQQPRGWPLGGSLGVGFGVFAVVAILCVVFSVAVYKRRKRERLPETQHLLAAADDHEIERDSPVAQNSKTTPVWQQIHGTCSSHPLTTHQLQIAASQLTEWKSLARLLGLNEPTITAIEHDNRDNMKEQRYQMLYKWSQMKGEGATLKTLVQCVEEKIQNRELAQKIYSGCCIRSEQ